MTTVEHAQVAETATKVSEYVEVPPGVSETFERWRRDETIPAAMRPGATVARSGDASERRVVSWDRDSCAPGVHGSVCFEAAGEGRTRITIELEPEPLDLGGRNAAPRARGLLGRFRDAMPASPNSA